MPWRATSVMEERIKFIVRALQADKSFKALCREFGVSRRTGYRWVSRYREAGSLHGVKELSRRPLKSPRRTAAEVEKRVIELRHEHGWGGKKLKELLAREKIELPVVTINRICKRHGLIEPEDSHRPATKRFERQHPNELWQMDFKGYFNYSGGQCHPLSILDDHSRFVVGLYALEDQLGDSVARCLVLTFERYGLPQAMLMDRGTPWWSSSNGYGLTWLAVSLIKQGIKLYQGAPRHPQTQGKVERFHRTLKHAILRRQRPQTLPAWQQALNSFRETYNLIRPHESLQMAVPAEHYQASPRAYNPAPSPWEYPSGAVTKFLNSQGCLDYQGRRYFVCEALSDERVQLQPVGKNLLVIYRHMYIREIELETGRTNSMVVPLE